jgi:hypothetical protein
VTDTLSVTPFLHQPNQRPTRDKPTVQNIRFIYLLFPAAWLLEVILITSNPEDEAQSRSNHAHLGVFTLRLGFSAKAL